MTPVDRSAIADFLGDVGGDQSLVDFVLATYEERAPSLVADLLDAIDRGDRSAAAGHAHDLASLSGQVGAMSLAERARALERLAECSDDPLTEPARIVAQRLPAVVFEVGAVRRDLAGLRPQPDSSR